MAIGSQGEIGTVFDTGPLHDWIHGGGAAWRAHVGDDLLGGYATVDYVTNHIELLREVNNDAIQMYPLRPYSEDTYQPIRANMLASWHAAGIVFNETDGGSN